MQKSPKPPYSNRGVENTAPNPLTALVDWFQVTFKNAENEQNIASLNYDSVEEYEAGKKEYFIKNVCSIMGLDFEAFKVNDKSIMGYKNMIQYGNIKILSNGHNSDMGVHVLMSGQACREYEQLNPHIPWDALFKRILAHCDNAGNPLFNITRLDVAIDERRYNGEKPFFTVKQLIYRAKKNLCRSLFYEGRQMEAFKLNGANSKGYTFYLGSEKSELSMRFYDKLNERIKEGFENEEELTAWIRTELQLRNERAYAMFLYIAINGEIGKNVLGVIAEYVNFVDRSATDSNKARWEVSRFWKSFLHGVGKLKLTMQAPDKTIESRMSWHKEQTARTLAVISLANDYDREYFQELFDIGLSKMTGKDFDDVELYRQKNKELLELITGNRLSEEEKTYAEKSNQRFELSKREARLHDTWNKLLDAKKEIIALDNDQGNTDD